MPRGLLHVSRPGCVWWGANRHRHTLHLACGIPSAPTPSVGVVALHTERNLGLWQFSGLSRLWLSGHLAWISELVASAFCSHGLDQITPNSGTATRDQLTLSTWIQSSMGHFVRGWTGTSYGDGDRHVYRRIDSNDIWNDTSLCAAGPVVHRTHEERSAKH